jgi:uncharacterized damage-inducible protein DinB
MRYLVRSLLLLAVPAVVGAQASSSMSSAAPGANPAVTALRTNWQGVTENIVKAAEQMPEADYAFRPIATVRSFGQLVGHVAGAQFSMCAAALGEKPRGEDDIEKSATTKTALVAALREATAYCARAYAQGDAAAAAVTTLYGEQVPRFNALALNAVHNGEHYGNIVTYLRVKGMVPPSSQR